MLHKSPINTKSNRVHQVIPYFSIHQLDSTMVNKLPRLYTQPCAKYQDPVVCRSRLQ